MFEETLKLRVEAGPRPPRHAHQPQQPRRSLLRRRPDGQGDPAARGRRSSSYVEARPNHPDTLSSGNNLAEAYAAAGQFDRAEPFYRGELEQARKPFGATTPYRRGDGDVGSGPPDAGEIGRCRARNAGMPGNPREAPARRLVYLQRSQQARRQLARPEEVAPKPSRFCSPATKE